MTKQMILAGWREWLALPDFNIPHIEAKVDTGTRTSVLHTSFIDPLHQHGKLWVRFGIHPLPERSDIRMIGFKPVLDRRMIKDSEGVDEVCFVVETTISLGQMSKSVELTLTKRDAKKFRMVLGRTALQELDLMISPTNTYLLGSAPRDSVVNMR